MIYYLSNLDYEKLRKNMIQRLIIERKQGEKLHVIDIRHKRKLTQAENSG